MPKISRQQIHNYSVNVFDHEIDAVHALLNRETVVVDDKNCIVFLKLNRLPNCRVLRCSELEYSPRKLPELPICETLICEHNKLSELPELPRCKYLNCGNNQLTELPALPQCTSLSCYHNKLTVLPALPNCESLYCWNNQLKTLPALPRCQNLDCRKNQLTELPALPRCNILNCSYNQLTELPALPECMDLNCSHNQIAVLPPLPKCRKPVINSNPIFPPELYQINRAGLASQKQFQDYITNVQADKSFLQQLKAIQNIDDKKQHLRRKYNFQSSPEFDEYLKAYLRQGIQSFNKRKQLRIKKIQYFAERIRSGLPIIDQQKQSEQNRISIISRIERSIEFLEELKAQPNLHENSITFIHDAQIALIEALKILSFNPQQYYKRKNIWIGFMKPKNVYLHDDRSNKTGFLYNVFNILDAIEKLEKRQLQQAKKLTSRINPMCLDAKIDSLHRFLISKIDVKQSFLGTCGNVISEAIAALPEGIKKMTRLDFINMLLRSTDMDELIMTLETDFDYCKKAAGELRDLLQDREIVPQNFIAKTPEEKFSLVNLIVDAILKLSYEVNKQGQILFQ